MSDAAMVIYESLDSIEKIEEMIQSGESEDLHLECKAPAGSRLTRDLRAHLAKALSAFANTAGGIILYGVETIRHSESNLDVLKQVVYVANCEDFGRQLRTKIPSLTTPPITNSQIKSLKQNPDDMKGVIVVTCPRFMYQAL